MSNQQGNELVSLEEQIGKPFRRIALAILLLIVAMFGFTIGFVLAQVTR
jgi:hypothetical protein